MDEAVPALAVVDARFCAGDEAALAVTKTISMSGNDFTVTDAATGDVLLRVDGVLFSLRRRCLLADAHRRPVLTVQESALVMNKRWRVFRGDSTSRRDLLFTVVKPSVIPLRWPKPAFILSHRQHRLLQLQIPFPPPGDSGRLLTPETTTKTAGGAAQVAGVLVHGGSVAYTDQGGTEQAMLCSTSAVPGRLVATEIPGRRSRGAGQQALLDLNPAFNPGCC